MRDSVGFRFFISFNGDRPRALEALHATAPRGITAIIMFFLVACACAAAPTVHTSKGELAGVSAGNVSIFYSVPYGSEPSGSLRYKPPVEHAAWNGTLNVSSVPDNSMCPQLLLVSGIPLFKGSEEHCLTLSVYAPATARPGDELAVMVWIPGGAFIEGGQLAGGLYNGTHLAAAGNVIVVSIQYRVGSLGFLYSPSTAKVSGNLGLLDQRLGMQWVQREIASFGGDPAKVTLFGESAGAISVCAHITAVASQGLFRAAIMESSVCDSTAFFNLPHTAEAYGDAFIEHVGCSGRAGPAATLTCLQQLPVDKACAPLLFPTTTRHAKPYSLPPLAPIIGWTPTLVPPMRMPVDAIRAQQPPTVPILIGTNKDEASLFIPLLMAIVPGVRLPLSDGDLKNVVLHFFNASATEAILAYYRNGSLDESGPVTRTRAARASESEASNTRGNVAIASAITTDYFWYCAARRIARTASSHQPRTFQYFFDFPLRWTGDCHGCEMRYVWDYQPRGQAFTPAKASLSHDLMQYWLAFAKSGGDPNDALPRVASAGVLRDAPERPVWPRFQEGSEAVMEFNTTRRVLTGGFQKELCDFWQGYHLAHTTSKPL